MTPRFNDQKRSAVIQIAGPGNEPKRTVNCTMRGMQGKRLGVDAAERIAVSTPINFAPIAVYS